MRLSLLINLRTSLAAGLLLMGGHVAFGQSADDYFHGGAQFYLSNNVAAAKSFATNGLKLYPNDEKLQKLYQLLNQQQQQQSQSQSQQQQQQDQQQQNQSQQNQQQKQDQKQQSQSQQDQQKQDQQKQDEQKKAEQKKEDEQKQAEQDQQKSDADKKDDKDNQNDQEKPAPGQMTPQEAKRMLDSQKDNEQLLQLKPKDHQNNNRPFKDW